MLGRPASSPPRQQQQWQLQHKQRAQSARPYGSRSRGTRQQHQQQEEQQHGSSVVDKVYRAASARSRRNVRAVHAAASGAALRMEVPSSPSSPSGATISVRPRPHTAAPLGQHRRAKLMQGAALSPSRQRRAMSAAPALRRSRAASARHTRRDHHHHHHDGSCCSGRLSPSSSAVAVGIFDEDGRRHKLSAPTSEETLAAATVGFAVSTKARISTEPAQPSDFVQSQYGRFDLAPMKLNVRDNSAAPPHTHTHTPASCPLRFVIKRKDTECSSRVR